MYVCKGLEHGQGDVWERDVQVNVDEGVRVQNSACDRNDRVQCDVLKRVVHGRDDDWCGVMNDRGKCDTYARHEKSRELREPGSRTSLQKVWTFYSMPYRACYNVCLCVYLSVSHAWGIGI